MKPGIMPSLHSSTVITPGQLGPTSLVLLFSVIFLALIMSRIGIPSDMQIIVSTPASEASMIAFAANLGGTKIIEAFAPVASLASVTVSKT
jgi:hypothetical protein